MTTRSLEPQMKTDAQKTGTGQLPPITSNAQKVMKRFFKHKMAIVGGIILAILYFFAIFADFTAPYGYASEARDKAFAPPTPVYLVNQDGSFSWPYTYNLKETFDQKTLISSFELDKSKKYYVGFFMRGEPYKLLGLIPTDIHLFGVNAPARIYLLGADIQGRDVFSRLLFGARISLTIGIFAIFIYYPIGMLIGGIAGYYGGWIDNILMRLVEAILAFPSFYLLLALAATLPDSLSSIQRYLLITVILSFISWAGLARVIRGMVLSLKQMEYVEASKAAGASDLWVIIKHILPQTSSWIIVGASTAIPLFTLGESSLSFLGLGIQDPQASWGNMLTAAKDYTLIISKPWLLAAPASMIVLTVLAFQFLGDGLRDAFDSKKRV